ncbi:hypothetical protein F4553_002782 [Allocatelliglobosispora scoriae]|uniref:Uncharacterized protein n=1 Tax=Allocatelliglobosispora scoriae TaxID=643052 RepID=A0A841BR66_9ACTN|nr:hypothetical protein [Allocatelliglobosispora scoriae]MBB5869403.1 hypothetical protein [Allocatelliglobosispora scoriae]
MPDITRAEFVPMSTTAALPPFDLADPPEDPPEACVDLTMWATARELFAEHQPVDGSCESCGTTDAPCSGLELAVQGLQAACGVRTRTWDFWTHLMQVRAELGSR